MESADSPLPRFGASMIADKRGNLGKLQIPGFLGRMVALV